MIFVFNKLCIVFLSLVSICAGVAVGVSGAVEYPRPQGYVNDYAGVIDPGTKQELERTLERLAAETGAEVAVAVVPDMGGLEESLYAVELFQSWGVGSKERNDGVLLLLAMKERRTRIEVGYGLEPIITDARSGQILDRHVIPHFRRNDFNAGIRDGALALAAVIAEERGVRLDLAAPEPAPRGAQARPEGSGDIPFPVLVIIALVLLFIFSGARGGGCLAPGCLPGCLIGSMLGGGRRRMRGPFNDFGGGFGGGFGRGGFGGGSRGGFGGGFGGGFSGGGGSSRGF